MDDVIYRMGMRASQMQTQLEVDAQLISDTYEKGVINKKERDELQGCRTNCEKIITLVYILTKKQHPMIPVFLKILRDSQKTMVWRMLIGKETSEGSHMDELERENKRLWEKIHELQGCSARGLKIDRPQSSQSADDSSEEVKALKQLMDQQEDYNKQLIRTAEECQRDYDQICRKNTALMKCLEEMVGEKGRMGADVEQSNAELEAENERLQDMVIRLESEIDDVSCRLSIVQQKVEDARKVERELKRQLELGPKASEEDIKDRIQELVIQNKMMEDSLSRMMDEYKKVNRERRRLEIEVETLMKCKSTLEFQARQQKQCIDRMAREKKNSCMIQRALSYRGEEETNAKAVSLQPVPTKEYNQAFEQFCVLCKAPYRPSQGEKCPVHVRPLRDGRWGCCGRDSGNAGCLKIPHVHVQSERSSRKIILTDGLNTMALSC